MNKVLILAFLCGLAVQLPAQSVVSKKDFSLGSPFNEPDGRNDVVKINATDIVTIAKVKGNVTGKSEFSIERYDQNLNVLWKSPVTADVFEDFKDLYYNGKDIVLLSVIHLESEKKTKLEAYGFDPANGKKLWTKELESYNVGDWTTTVYKGKVKESFIDVICEHVDRNFVTPFEYKHNIRFSPDNSKFVSYVYNYGEKNLSAEVCVYDKTCKLISKSKVSIDNNFINHGIYVNNAGTIFIINSNASGKLNVIRYNMETKDFDILDLPGSNFVKDDFQVFFVSDDMVYVACTELVGGSLVGVMYTQFDFAKKEVVKSVFESISGNTGAKILKERAAYKLIKGEEDWRDYDITHFWVDKNGEVTLVLEKHTLYGEGYPHIGRDVFDVSHKVKINGHVQAEGVIIFMFGKNEQLQWVNYIPKNQVYSAADGLNTISFALDNTNKSSLRLIYAFSENLDATVGSLAMVTIDKNSGKKAESRIPNDDRLIFVKDYTVFNEDGSFVFVGKKGLLGKASSIVKMKN